MILVFDTELKAQTALAQIDSNIGCPIAIDDYTMQTWANIRKAVNDSIWWFIKPTDQYYGNNYYTAAQAMNGVTDYTEQQAPNTEWLPEIV